MTSKVKKNIIISFWILFILAVLGNVIFFYGIYKGWIGYMPSLEQLDNPIDKYASQIISADGKTLGSYAFSQDNRVHVNYNDLSPDLVRALIATEDVRFAQHSGVDVPSIFRAVVKTGILQQKSGGGGSTITQQLAKLLYTEQASDIKERLFQKPIEWVIAVQLERKYTKEEIIDLYFNQFDFLYNAVGIQSASKVYFETTPKGLRTEEAATLVGMCKNPAYFNPVRHTERTRGRRNVVLDQMEKAGYLSAVQADSLKNLPLKTRFKRIDHKEGPAPYFREYLRMVLTASKPVRENYNVWQQQKFVEDSVAWETDPLFGWCQKNHKSDGRPYNIYTDGLKIYTTIDSRMQQYAEEAVDQHVGGYLQPAFFNELKNKRQAPYSSDLSVDEVERIMDRSMRQTDRYKSMKKNGLEETEIKRIFKDPVEMSVFSWHGQIDTLMSPWDSIRYVKSFLRTGFMSMEPSTGHVKAYVGGIDYNDFQYDMVNGGRRQVGSTMKPFVYSLAMIEGFTPCDGTLHVQQYLRDENGRSYTPKTSTTARMGEWVTLQWGLQVSSNWITAYLMSKLSPYTLTRLLRSYGVRGEIDPVISMALGTPDVSVGEMVSAYTVFANKGIRVDPVYVTRIEDPYGNVIASFLPHMTEVLPEDAAYKMVYMLRSVIDGGTGSRVRRVYNITAPMGGKTGTTQNNSDGWFMAFTPSLVSGCWVGGEERSIHFDRMAYGQGASMALPIYGLFMQKVYADPTLGYSQTEDFDVPADFNPCAKEYYPGTTDQYSNTQADSLKANNVGGIDQIFE